MNLISCNRWHLLSPFTGSFGVINLFLLRFLFLFLTLQVFLCFLFCFLFLFGSVIYIFEIYNLLFSGLCHTLISAFTHSFIHQRFFFGIRLFDFQFLFSIIRANFGRFLFTRIRFWDLLLFFSTFLLRFTLFFVAYFFALHFRQRV